MDITIKEAYEIHTKGFAVVADGDVHSFFIVKDEEAEDVES